ncbi:hypothetical protein [Modestobacter sp. I12A-02662]|uniref:hypothetical protein n=1 Tax=Modestobacter sp. I12A-02662 TaxID=1730496 RepID=UPI0034DF8119
MTTRGARTAAATALLLVLAGCARPGADGADGGPSSASPYGPDDLVLQLSWTGGFVTPEMLAGRLPLVSVYGDGRVISEGPVIAIHPAPALPNLQVREIGGSAVQDLVDRALEAGVGDTTDLGTPPVADLPSTRFTVSTGLETIQREVYALTVPEDQQSGLTEEQLAARAELRAFADELTGLSYETTQPYEFTTLAALVMPYTPPEEEELAQPDVPWPGPALPGEPFEPALGLSCVVAAGEDASAVRTAARAANALTPWVAPDGVRWSLTFRPMLPHETGCADLRTG